jgi:hypothetical protein
MPRIAPADQPYPTQIAAALARVMPAGVAPLVLFRTLARNPRVFEKMFAGGLLDKGFLSLRQREVVIDRTTARLGAETWARLAAHFDEAQMLEVVALVGYYHTISFLCRALDLPLETYGARFPD